MLVVLGKSRDQLPSWEMVAHGTCSGFVVKPSDVESHLFCPSFQMFDGLFRVQVICPYLACPLTVPTSLHGLHIISSKKSVLDHGRELFCQDLRRQKLSNCGVTALLL